MNAPVKMQHALSSEDIKTNPSTGKVQFHVNIICSHSGTILSGHAHVQLILIQLMDMPCTLNHFSDKFYEHSILLVCI